MAKAEKKQPWFKFFPSNWRGSPELRLCSIGARGLWMEMLCLMHEAEPYGHLINNGIAVSNKQLAALAGISLTDVMKFMCEMEAAGVYSRTDDKVIYSRKMVRDKAKAEQAKDWGSTGGNPELVGEDNGRVNPPVKGRDKPKKQQPPSSPINHTAAADARALDEMGLKQEGLLRAAFTAECAGRPKAPDMSIIGVWLLDGISMSTISLTVPPILRRKRDMATLAYCDAAVREAHAKAPPPADLQVVSQKVFVEVGTLAWTCWVQWHRDNKRAPPIQRDTKVENVIKTGWWFDSEFPPGYDEATGERIAPQSEENAA